MLRVRVELIPHGNEAQAREIGRMEITNLGTHDDHPRRGDYMVRSVTHHPNGDTQISTRGLKGFERLKYNCWGIVLAAIACFGNEGLESTGDDRHSLGDGG